VGAELNSRWWYVVAIFPLTFGVIERTTARDWTGLLYVLAAVIWCITACLADWRMQKLRRELADTREVLHAALRHDPPSLVNVHKPEACEGQHCVIHNPSDHSMREWPLHWRGDRGIMERKCPEHGIGHPDPDDMAYRRRAGKDDGEGIHGCCGCCAS
jgi:hypothetical protein